MASTAGFSLAAFRFRIRTGSIVRWYNLLIDIDERKRAEQELRRSEARKAAILDSALECIVTIDHEGCITEFNPAAERTFGYRRDEVLGQQLADIIIPPALRERHRQGFARYLATGEARVLGQRIEMTARTCRWERISRRTCDHTHPVGRATVLHRLHARHHGTQTVGGGVATQRGVPGPRPTPDPDGQLVVGCFDRGNHLV